MNGFTLRVACATLLLGTALGGAASASAQATPERDADSSTTWPSRIAFTLQAGQFNPRGASEAFRLFDAALSRGSSALAPRLTSGAVRVRAWRKLSVVGAFEGGDRTVRSYSIVQPATAAARIEQQTRFVLTGMQTLGVQWRAWQWRQSDASRDRLHLFTGAGLGRTQYSLRQWGEFVDVNRRVAFSDDLASRGRATLRYLSATAEAPVRRWGAVQLEARRQWGSAAMNGDYATFDALDLSGTKVSLGFTFSPWAR